MRWLSFSGLRRTAACLAALAGVMYTAESSHAGLTDLQLSIQDAAVAAGSTGNGLDITLTNTGEQSVDIGGFSLRLVASSTDISFTQVTYNTTTAAYIFAGSSVFGGGSDGSDITIPPDSLNGLPALPGQDISAQDIGATFTLGAHQTIGLGHLVFDVSPTAQLYSTSSIGFSFPDTNLSDATLPVAVDISYMITSSSPGTVTVVPEPATITIAAIGGLAVFGYSRRRRGRTS